MCYIFGIKGGIHELWYLWLSIKLLTRYDNIISIKSFYIESISNLLNKQSKYIIIVSNNNKHNVYFCILNKETMSTERSSSCSNNDIEIQYQYLLQFMKVSIM